MFNRFRDHSSFFPFVINCKSDTCFTDQILNLRVDWGKPYRGRTSYSRERLTAEREVLGWILESAPILRVLKYLRKEGTTITLQTVGPSLG